MNIYSLVLYLQKKGKFMPALDGTGPQGMGPKTGRQLGNCRNAQATDQKPAMRLQRRRRLNRRFNSIKK